MIFKQEYKNQCFNAYRYCPFIDMIMANLDAGKEANVRSFMDAAIDDLQQEINQPIGEGEHAIHNARVLQLRAMYICWYELFEILDTTYELLPDRSSEQLSS